MTWGLKFHHLDLCCEAHVPEEGISAWLEDFHKMAWNFVYFVWPLLNANDAVLLKAKHPLVQFAAIAPFLAEAWLSQGDATSIKHGMSRVISRLESQGKDAIPILVATLRIAADSRL